MKDQCLTPTRGDQTSIKQADVSGFLDAAGAIAELYRNTDWSATSIGAPDGWNRALRAGVRTIFGTGHPAFILWGPSGACLFNQAYFEAVQPPHALGSPARIVAAPSWDILGEQFEQVIGGGPATWRVNQLIPTTVAGQRRDLYWTYSLGPIDDPSAVGGIGGVLVLCTLATNPTVAEKPAFAAAELRRILFEHSPSFLAIVHGPQHHIEFANEAFRRFAGARDIIGRTTLQVLPWAEEQGFIALLNTVLVTGVASAIEGAVYRTETRAGAPVTDIFLDLNFQPLLDTDGAVSGICIQGNDVTKSMQAINRLSRLARIDDLTGLANRSATFEAIERAIVSQSRNGTTFSLLYVDLDGFKHLNDGNGHGTGDEALGHIAGALSAVIRPEDTAGRVGGDEFALVIIGGRIAAEAIADRVRAEIGVRMAARGWPVGASVGVVVFDTPPQSAEAALAAADAAMYVVKRAARTA